MSELVSDCPRCKSKQITFDLLSQVDVGMRYGWQQCYEAFCVCRACRRTTVFILNQSKLESRTLLRNPLSELNFAVNRVMSVGGHISLKDELADAPPEHLPDRIDRAFREGAKCLAVECPNAAATMFRLCVDLATKPLLPKDEAGGPNSAIRRNLGLRLPWLFENGVLPRSLQDLSACIKDDGNDGAHDGTLTAEDATDLLDFTRVLLERLFTEPKRVEIAKERRIARRASKGDHA